MWLALRKGLHMKVSLHIISFVGRAAAQEAAASTAADVQLAMLFPPAQRPYILFLHAADSHRLNRSLLRSVNPSSL
jgi:hypothetical protein